MKRNFIKFIDLDTIVEVSIGKVLSRMCLLLASHHLDVQVFNSNSNQMQQMIVVVVVNRLVLYRQQRAICVVPVESKNNSIIICRKTARCFDIAGLYIL